MTVSLRRHAVAVAISGQQITGWSSYSIHSSMIDPVDTATLTLPWSRSAWDLVRPDSPIRITIDGVVVLDGYLDDREAPASDDTIVITARDRCGRLVNESAPGINYQGLTMTQTAAQLAAPWFSTVTLSNARNRRVRRGRGRKATSGSEPVLVDPRKDGLIAEPGQTRMEVLSRLLDQANMICWSAGDGSELVIGRPNYDQDLQWRFFRPAPGSRRMAEGNVLGLGLKESTADRYSRVIVVGAGRGTTGNYSATALSARYGEARDNPSTEEGTGGDFTAPKRLVMQLPVASNAEAVALAEQHLRRGKATAHQVTVSAPAHGQILAGGVATLYCPDTMAHVECERTGVRGAYLVTACRYESDRSGERTTLDLVPKGTELST